MAIRRRHAAHSGLAVAKSAHKTARQHVKAAKSAHRTTRKQLRVAKSARKTTRKNVRSTKKARKRSKRFTHRAAPQSQTQTAPRSAQFAQFAMAVEPVESKAPAKLAAKAPVVTPAKPDPLSEAKAAVKTKATAKKVPATKTPATKSTPPQRKR